MEHGIRIGPRLSRHSEQRHSRLPGSASGLAVVTWLARADNVVPRVRTAPRPWQNVVQCQVSRLRATVLAAKTVPDEHFSPRKLPAVKRTFDHVVKANDAGFFDDVGSASEEFSGLANRLSLAFSEQRDSTPHIADIQRLVVLV